MPSLGLFKADLIQKQLQEKRRLVSVDSYDLSVRQLIDMYSAGDIYIPKEYQRQFVWDEDRESKLIESIFLGIPVPNLFMATNVDATWEIVDGVQRLCTLIHYIGNDELLEAIGKKASLKIVGLEKVAALRETKFKQLPKSIQLGFYNRPLRVTVLNDKSDEDVRFDLFERLNTGGISLTAQEIRNCIFRGDYSESLKRLSVNSNFSACVKLKDSEQSNGTKEELVLRFFAFLDQYKEFDHSVKDFLNSYMKKHAKQGLGNSQNKLFDEVFAFIKKELPRGIARGNRNLTPIILYEAIAVGTALAMRKNKRLRTGVLRQLVNDPKLKKLTTGATNSNKMVVGRIDYVAEALLS